MFKGVSTHIILTTKYGGLKPNQTMSRYLMSLFIDRLFFQNKEVESVDTIVF